MPYNYSFKRWTIRTTAWTQLTLFNFMEMTQRKRFVYITQREYINKYYNV